MILRTDGFDITPISGTTQYDGGTQTASLFVDATVAIAQYDWIAILAGNTANPGGIDGETYCAADATGTTDESNYDVVGVALEALASGTGFIQVQIAGRVASARVDAAVDADDVLCVGTTKGEAIEQVFDAATTANRRSIGVARAAASSNYAACDVWRHNKFGGP